MRVVYIAGMSHSGSTLLNLMLNAHPEMMSVGELIDLARRAIPQDATRTKYTPCPCGAPSLWECQFWSRVNARTLEVDGNSLADLDVLIDRELDERSAANAVVLRAIADVSGKNFIVDSSKRPGRLSYLLQLKGLDVFPIHMVRDPHGQVSSLHRSKGGLLRHIYSYARMHGQIRRTVKSIPHSVVLYEDLVRDPERTLSNILKPLGLRFDPCQLEWADQVHHTLGGNNLRWQPRSLVLDERWKQNLSPFQQALVRFGTAYSRRHFDASMPHAGIR